MHTSPPPPPTEWSAVSLIVLAGNPNVGKSVVFNALTGSQVDVSNFPGTTVSISKGRLSSSSVALHDTPGVYGLSGLSEEERVTAAALEQADVVVNVVSAPTLQRDLFFTQQLLDWGFRLVVAVNQLDELELNGGRLDLDALARQLGVPVVGCVATTGKGLDTLKTMAIQARLGNRTPGLPLPQATRQLENHPPDRLQVYAARRQYLNQWVRSLWQPDAATSGATQATKARWRRPLEAALLHPVWGALALVAMLMALYQFIGVWVAGDLVNLLEGTVLLGWVVPTLERFFAWVFPLDSPLYTLFAGEFGLVTMTTRYILGVMLPLVFGFYLFLAILEDSGYLPYLAVLADGLLNRVGLNGRAIIPMVLGLGCVTMATVSTRVLTSQRERTIANALLAITIPCSAQLGVIMGMVALIGGLKAWALYIVLLAFIFGLLGTVLNVLLPGKSSGLVMDLPPLRWPRPKPLLKKTWHRSTSFLWEATPLFLLGAAIVSVAMMTGALAWLEQTLAPLTESLLLLPKEAASAFLMGMVRRDFGLAGFYTLQQQLSAAQLMTSLITITLFVPCIASATVMWKERGWQEGAWVLGLSWTLAFGVGALVARLLGWFPVLG